MDNDDDEVGYCKPPKKSQWKPKQSGNPKGRPKRSPPKISVDIAEIVRRLDAELIQVRGRKVPRRELELMKLGELEIKGNKQARRLLDRLRLRRPRAVRGGVVHSTKLWEESIKRSSR